MSAYDKRRERLAETIKLLATHEPFRAFMHELGNMRDMAIQDACRNEVLDNPTKIAASMGEIRAYLDICALVDEFTPKNLE